MRPKNTYLVILLLSDDKNQIENDKKWWFMDSFSVKRQSNRQIVSALLV